MKRMRTAGGCKIKKFISNILEDRMTFHKIIAEDILISSISWKFAQLFNILQKMYEIVGSCGEGRDYLQNLDENRLAL